MMLGPALGRFRQPFWEGGSLLGGWDMGGWVGCFIILCIHLHKVLLDSVRRSPYRVQQDLANFDSGRLCPWDDFDGRERSLYPTPLGSWESLAESKGFPANGE